MKCKVIPSLPDVKPITAVSYSRLQMYDWCPATVRYKVCMGLKEPDSPQMARGNETHKMLERVLKAPGAKMARLPKEYQHLAPELLMVRKDGLGIEAEGQFAFDHNWKPVEYFSSHVWWRMKIDLRYLYNDAANGHNVVARLLDFKTGKVKPEEHTEQLQLYALVELLRSNGDYPDRIETSVFYVDHEPEPRTLAVYESPNAKLLKTLQTYWAKKANKFTKDVQLRPTPSEFKCGRCFYSEKRGGPCKSAVA